MLDSMYGLPCPEISSEVYGLQNLLEFTIQEEKVINKRLSFNYGIGLGLEKMSLGDTVTLASNTLDDGGTPDDGSDDFVRRS